VVDMVVTRYGWKFWGLKPSTRGEGGGRDFSFFRWVIWFNYVVDHPLPSSAEILKRIKLYLISSICAFTSSYVKFTSFFSVSNEPEVESIFS
jgi:hypothetical protein